MHESQGESNDEQHQHERHRQQIDQDGLDRARAIRWRCPPDSCGG